MGKKRRSKARQRGGDKKPPAGSEATNGDASSQQQVTEAVGSEGGIDGGEGAGGGRRGGGGRGGEEGGRGGRATEVEWPETLENQKRLLTVMRLKTLGPFLFRQKTLSHEAEVCAMEGGLLPKEGGMWEVFFREDDWRKAVLIVQVVLTSSYLCETNQSFRDCLLKGKSAVLKDTSMIAKLLKLHSSRMMSDYDVGEIERMYKVLRSQVTFLSVEDVSSPAHQFLETQEEKEQLIQPIKERGNANFKESRYRAAIGDYSRAINISPYSAVLYSNRSLCHVKNEDHWSACVDSFKALALRPEWEKPYFRCSEAWMYYGNYYSALNMNFLGQESCSTTFDLIRQHRALLLAIEGLKRRPIPPVIKYPPPPNRRKFQSAALSALKSQQATPTDSTHIPKSTASTDDSTRQEQATLTNDSPSTARQPNPQATPTDPAHRKPKSSSSKQSRSSRRRSESKKPAEERFPSPQDTPRLKVQSNKKLNGHRYFDDYHAIVGTTRGLDASNFNQTNQANVFAFKTVASEPHIFEVLEKERESGERKREPIEDGYHWEFRHTISPRRLRQLRSLGGAGGGVNEADFECDPSEDGTFRGFRGAIGLEGLSIFGGYPSLPGAPVVGFKVKEEEMKMYRKREEEREVMRIERQAMRNAEESKLAHAPTISRPFTEFEQLRSPSLSVDISTQQLFDMIKPVQSRQRLLGKQYMTESEAWRGFEPLPPLRPPIIPTSPSPSALLRMNSTFDELWCPLLAGVSETAGIIPPKIHYVGNMVTQYVHKTTNLHDSPI